MRAKYFTLDPEKKGPDDEYAVASRMAMLTYAEKIVKVDLDLASEIVLWVKEEIEKDKIKWRGKQPKENTPS